MVAAVLITGPVSAAGAFPCEPAGITGGAARVECVPSPVPLATETATGETPLLLVLSAGIGTVALLVLLMLAVRRHMAGRGRFEEPTTR